MAIFRSVKPKAAAAMDLFFRTDSPESEVERPRFKLSNGGRLTPPWRVENPAEMEFWKIEGRITGFISGVLLCVSAGISPNFNLAHYGALTSDLYFL